MDAHINQQLNKQQMDLLFGDIDQLISLYEYHEKQSFDAKGYINSGNYERLLTRLDRCMVKLDYWGSQVVLDSKMMDKFRKYKNDLEEKSLWIAHCAKKYRLVEESGQQIKGKRRKAEE